MATTTGPRFYLKHRRRKTNSCLVNYNFWRNTFVVHCFGLIRRYVRLNGALRVLSRPYNRLRLHNQSLPCFFSFLLLWKRWRQSFSICGSTYSVFYVRAPPTGRNRADFKGEVRWTTGSPKRLNKIYLSHRKKCVNKKLQLNRQWTKHTCIYWRNDTLN